MTYRVVFVAAFASCATPSVLIENSVGVVHPVGASLADDGTEVRMAFGMGEPGHNDGGGVQFTFRSAGITQELALGIHRYGVAGVGKHTAAFGRIGINLLEWDRVGTDDGLGIAGPSFELGIGPRDGTGPCLVASVSRDFRFNDRDDTLLGLSLGACGIVLARK